VQSGVTQYQIAPELNGTSFTAGYDFINNDSHPNDNEAHGTHVSGTVAQVTNNSTGVAGMAFDCTLMPVKVLDYSGSGTAQSLADGLYWATDNGAQVINMSLGWSPGYNPGSTVANAVTYAYNHGVVLLASSGNAGVGVVSYPAAYPEVISVGATRYDNARPSYSQYGSDLEICAPGGDMSVDQNGDTYGDGVLQMTFTGYNPGPPEQLSNPTDFGYWFYDGTSMACPHATALVAMMIANGQTGVENIRTILHETAVDLGSAGWDQYYGYGRIDAYAALTYGGNPPVAEFSGSPTSGCAPLTVNFTDLSTGEIDTWDWTFGDGGTSTAQNPSHQYANPGTYTVSLTVSGSNGSDTETKTGYITVDEAPVAGFVGSPTSGCAPLTVNFTNQSTGTITSYDWDFGDGGSSTAASPSHQYPNPGTYTVTLTVTGPCGSDAEVKTNYISVGATLVADFSGTPTSGCSPLTVNFTDASTGDITSYDWDFGDGGTSTAQNPSHQYTSPGDYTVTLTVTGSCGSDSEVKTDYITVDGPPVADFYGDPTSGSAPLTVSFYDQSSGQVTSYDWDFGDGGTSTAQNPIYDYALAGDYTVTLTVTGPCGSDVETKVDYISATSGDIVKDYATQDILVAGTVTGTYANTFSSDNVYESILERKSGGRPPRHSYLEHKWTVNVTGGSSVTFYVEAHQSASPDGDNFVFAYSTNDAVYTDLVTVASTTDQVYSAVMPSSVSGTVYVRVTDTDRTAGNDYYDEIFVDEMYIESSTINDPTPPQVTLTSPNGGETWQAGQVCAITWNATDNIGVTSCDIDYTYDAGSNWFDVADLSGNPGTYDWTVPNTPSTTCMVRVTVYDAASNSDVDQSDSYFTILELVEEAMYVNSIAMVAGRAGANRYATATPEVVADATGVGIEGVVVTGHWSGAATDTDQCTTGPDGKCTVRSDNIKKPTQDFCFTVDALAVAGYYWDDTKGVKSNCIAPAANGGEILAAGTPVEFFLSDAHPNPFSSVTEFSLNLPRATRVTFVVYNMMGQRVATLVDEEIGAGSYVVSWDGTNLEGSPVSSGIYFYRVFADDKVVTKKIVLSR
jgi:PKD repeat protein